MTTTKKNVMDRVRELPAVDRLAVADLIRLEHADAVAAAEHEANERLHHRQSLQGALARAQQAAANFRNMWARKIAEQPLRFVNQHRELQAMEAAERDAEAALAAA